MSDFLDISMITFNIKNGQECNYELDKIAEKIMYKKIFFFSDY